MSLQSGAIRDALVSHAMATGAFDATGAHEPRSAPGNGLSIAVWADSLGPASTGSGLAATTALIVFQMRIYASSLSEPQDSIDPAVMQAMDALIARLLGDLQLDGLSGLSIDVRSRSGTRFWAQAGYVKIGDALSRVMTLTVPVFVNDAWEEVQ